VRISQASKNQPLSNGRKVFAVTATDWLGNTVTKEFVLTVDNTLPVTVTPPSDKNKPGGPGKGVGGGGGGLGAG
ncbi:MAG TPA: hypothetical protein VMI31_01695, partial [Fimbriimonadaceae bacterium]|nr:hypothetical protein [Fimbriimonadaceae bacterium]